jgi:hypothetical protein
VVDPAAWLKGSGVIIASDAELDLTVTSADDLVNPHTRAESNPTGRRASSFQSRFELPRFELPITNA